MNIEEYVYFITKTPFPFLFLLCVIFCEYVVLRWQGKKFSFLHSLSNFGILFIGIIIFWLFDHFVLARADVLAFTEQYSLFTPSVSWGMFFVWLIVFDFVNYWTHVLYHKSNFFWMFHAVHHSDKTVDASTTIRVPVTASFFTVTSYAFLSFFGVSIILLPALAQTMFLQQVLVHSFLFRGLVPSFVSYLFVTPDLHALHHTEKYNNKNYSFLFSVWDILFKTVYMGKRTDEVFGVDTHTSGNNPLLAHIDPVRHFFRKK